MRLKVAYLERLAVGPVAAWSNADRVALSVEASVTVGRAAVEAAAARSAADRVALSVKASGIGTTVPLRRTLRFLAADDSNSHGEKEDEDRDFLQIKRD